MFKVPELLLISNDVESCRKLSNTLIGQNYKVIKCTKFMELENLQKKMNFDLYIIDLAEDCSKEWKLALKIRENSNNPIIVISHDIENCERLLGYDLANDFVKKPYNIMEVLCRVNILLNKKDSLFKGEQIIVDDIKIDCLKRKVLVREQEVELTQKEFELLYYLLVNSDRVITREELIKEIWKDNFRGNNRTVDTHIKKLRKKIEKYSPKDYINTVWGIGYRVVV